MCSFRQLSLGFLFGSTILYALVSTLFSYKSDHKCFGDWGPRCPPLQYKTGNGKCVLTFELSFLNNSLFYWESWYSGGWKEGTKHGWGEFLSLSGSSYKGEWKNNMRDGTGVYKLSDGSKFEGEWKEDKFTGRKNKLEFNMTRNKYPEASILLNQTQYNGFVLEGLMDGEGSLTFGKSGRRLSGKFREGKLHGPAEITLQSGEIVKVEEFTDNWALGTYTAQSSLTTTFDGKLKWLDWDGSTLRMEEEDIIVNSPSLRGLNNSSITELSSEENRSQEIYDILNALKWFEFHFIFSKPLLESEIYPFDYVEEDIKDKQKSSMESPQRMDL